MKTCPVCHAQCFDDMEVCYGCLYRFPSQDQTMRNGANQSGNEQGIREKNLSPEDSKIMPQQYQSQAVLALQQNEAFEIRQEGSPDQQQHATVSLSQSDTPVPVKVSLADTGVEITILIRPCTTCSKTAAVC